MLEYVLCSQEKQFGPLMCLLLSVQGKILNPRAPSYCSQELYLKSFVNKKGIALCLVYDFLILSEMIRWNNPKALGILSIEATTLQTTVPKVLMAII